MVNIIFAVAFFGSILFGAAFSFYIFLECLNFERMTTDRYPLKKAAALGCVAFFLFLFCFFIGYIFFY